MERLQQYMKRIYEKIKALSMRWKIIIGAAIGVLLILIIILSTTYNSSGSYGVLFSGLSSVDGKNIMDQLKAQKVSFKVSGSTIYVPSSQVGQLRLQLASSKTNGSVGYELFNSTPTMGQTDEQFQIEKLRATQGELERTIKSFPQVENVRVHLALPQESAFVSDNTPGKVSVYLTLKTGMTLSKSQVKAIIALISGSLDNVPAANVNIVDDHLNLLSASALSDNSDESSAEAVEGQQAMVTKFQNKLADSIQQILVPVFGANNVKIQVNAQLNFDAKEKTTISYDPNKVLLSRHLVIQGSGLGQLQTNSSSPVDNNMGNYAITTGSSVTAGGITQIDDTQNNNVGSTTEKVISAPGQVTRLTASVLYDSSIKLTTAQQALIKSEVETAIGFDATRNDQVTVGPIAFDQAAKAADLAEINALKSQTAQAAKMQLYKLIAVGAGAGIVVLGTLIFFLSRAMRKRRAAKKARKALDVTVGDEPLFDQEVVPHIPIDFNTENETDLIEQDIKRYAEEKPDQVADIIKSWLAEDER